MDHYGGVEFIRRCAVGNIVRVGIVRRTPFDEGASFVFFGPENHELFYFLRGISVTISENPESAQRKFACWHMNIFQLDVARLNRFCQFNIFMRHIRFVGAFVHEDFPFFPIQGIMKLVLMILVCSLSETVIGHILICIIYLNGIDGAYFSQI